MICNAAKKGPRSYTAVPEVAGISNRDTSVVVGDLFRRAERSVLVVGYAVHQGQKLFLDLADRMQLRPELHVRMYLDIKREIADTSTPEEIVRRFVHRFRTTQWPLEKRLPEIYFDPRALSINAKPSARFQRCCNTNGENADANGLPTRSSWVQDSIPPCCIIRKIRAPSNPGILS